jgi:hypothetical protein
MIAVAVFIIGPGVVYLVSLQQICRAAVDVAVINE